MGLGSMVGTGVFVSSGVAAGVAGPSVILAVLIGDVRVTWSFSVFTVLIDYALTNLAALQLSKEE